MGPIVAGSVYLLFCYTILWLSFTKEAYNILITEIIRRYIIFNWQLKFYIPKLCIKYLNVLKDIFYNKLLLIKNRDKSRLIELFWTITPSVILILIAFPSLKSLDLRDVIIDPSCDIYGEDHQWYWSDHNSEFFKKLALDSSMLNATGNPGGGGGGFFGGLGNGSGPGLPGQPNPGGGSNVNYPVLPDQTSKDSQNYCQGGHEPNQGEGSNANLTGLTDQSPLTNSTEECIGTCLQQRGGHQYLTRTLQEFGVLMDTVVSNVDLTKLKEVFLNSKLSRDPKYLPSYVALTKLQMFGGFYLQEVHDLESETMKSFHEFIVYLNQIPAKYTEFKYTGANPEMLCWREGESHWVYSVKGSGKVICDLRLNVKFLQANNSYVMLREVHDTYDKLERVIGFKFTNKSDNIDVIYSIHNVENYEEYWTPRKMEATIKAKKSIREQIPDNVFKENWPR